MLASTAAIGLGMAALAEVDALGLGALHAGAPLRVAVPVGVRVPAPVDGPATPAVVLAVCPAVADGFLELDITLGSVDWSFSLLYASASDGSASQAP